MASAVLIAVGAASVPAGVNPVIGLVVAVIGAVGFGIKEWLGGKK